MEYSVVLEQEMKGGLGAVAVIISHCSRISPPGAVPRWLLIASWAVMRYGAFCVLAIAVGFETASLKSGIVSLAAGHPTVPGTVMQALWSQSCHFGVWQKDPGASTFGYSSFLCLCK